MSATPETLREAVASYANAVSDALTEAGIGLVPGYVLGAGDPLTVRIHTTRHRNDDPWREVAVIEWQGEHGWSAGWFTNTMGGGTVHYRVWLGVGLAPEPRYVAQVVKQWFSTPEDFAGTEVASGDGLPPLHALLAEHTTTTADAPKVGPEEELRRLRATMATDGLDAVGHKRAAELFLATYGDEFSQFDLAAGQIHATLAAGTSDHANVAALRKSVTYWQGLALDLKKRVDGEVDDRVAAMAEELQQTRANLSDAEARAASVRDAYYREGEKAEAFAARAAQAALDRNRYRARSRAVEDLCSALRQEGLVAIARRIEGAMRDSDIATAQQRTEAQATGAADPSPQPDQTWLVEQGAKITADECARCGSQIVRGQLDDGPWTHNETGSPVCKSGGAKTAMPKTYADLVGQRVVVLGDNGVRSHGFLRATSGDLLCLDDVDETFANVGIDLRIDEIANVAATGPRTGGQPTNTLPNGVEK